MTKTKSIGVLLTVFLFLGGLGVWGVFGLLGQIQQGRQAAVQITCAVLTSVSQAGRDVIAGPPNTPETPFTRALERLGYPSNSVRRQQAEKAADAYVGEINRSVISAVGAQKARGIVLPGGSINCRRLLSISKAQ